MKEPQWLLRDTVLALLLLPEAEATVKTLALAARELDETGYGTWLQKHSHKA